MCVWLFTNDLISVGKPLLNIQNSNVHFSLMFWILNFLLPSAALNMVLLRNIVSALSCDIFSYGLPWLSSWPITRKPVGQYPFLQYFWVSWMITLSNLRRVLICQCILNYFSFCEIYNKFSLLDLTTVSPHTFLSDILVFPI